MKTVFLTVIRTLGIVMFFAVPSAAQSCGQMYTYSDFWYDENVSAVLENFTDGDPSCGDYTAFSEISVSIVSGASYYASSTAGCCAEAIASVSSSDQVGDFYLDGYNEVNYACESTASAFALFSTKVLLVTSSCGVNPISHLTQLQGVWSKGGELGVDCTLSDQTTVSVENNGCNNDSTRRGCYSHTEGQCSHRYCVGKTRQAYCDSLRWADKQFPIERIDTCIQ